MSLPLGAGLGDDVRIRREDADARNRREVAIVGDDVADAVCLHGLQQEQIIAVDLIGREAGKGCVGCRVVDGQVEGVRYRLDQAPRRPYLPNDNRALMQEGMAEVLEA